MKKIILTLFCVCCIVLLTLFDCFAWQPTEDYWQVTPEEYKTIIKENPPTDDFITYEQISFLGELKRASLHKDYELNKVNGYDYVLITEQNEEIRVCFNKFPFWPQALQGLAHISASDHTDLIIGTDMLKLDTTALMERLELTSSGEKYFYVDTKEVIYWYNEWGDLICIELNTVDLECIISMGDFDYSKCAPDGWVGRLIHPESAPLAAAEIEARISGFYQEPWEQPLTIALSALSGAAVAAVTAWAITCFAMRKRAKNSPRSATCAGIDVPTEDAPPPDGAQDSTPTPPEETPSNTPTDNDNTVIHPLRKTIGENRRKYVQDEED